MPSNLGGDYSSGTLTINNGATTFVGVGSFWATIAEEGDWLWANGTIGIINTIVDNNNGTLKDPWTGSNLAGSSYRIIKMSWLRFDIAYTQAQVNRFITLLAGQTIVYQVPASQTVPDPGVGEDGQLAVQLGTGTWKFWVRTSGVWVIQGNPIGFTNRGLWDASVQYIVGDVVARNGSAYVAKLVGTNHDPISSPSFWDLFLAGGTTYDIAIWDSSRPSASEILTRIVFPRAVTFGTNFNGSVASAGVAATAQAIYTLQKNGTNIGTITFAASGTIGAFSGAQVTFNVGDVLTLIAPSVRDATLANVAFTLTGSR